jgi:4-hydroxy-4-methyl-2-oxoglutarate aldolase
VRVKSIQAIRAKLAKIGPAAISDALGKTNAMNHAIKPRSANPSMAGPAFTVRVHTADILMVSKALSECPKGNILVIDGHGECNTALWGGLTTEAAFRKGLAGVVIDGAIRDSTEIARSRLPVFARAIVAGAGGAEYAGELQIPIQCGGVVVNPGDWLVGDEDGVVAIPNARLSEAMHTASRILEAENRIALAIRAGEDLGAILQCDAVLDRKAAEVFVPQLRVQEGRRRTKVSDLKDRSSDAL